MHQRDSPEILRAKIPPGIPATSLSPSTPRAEPRGLTVQCQRKEIALTRGSGTTDGRFAYITPKGSNSVYGYELHKQKWEQFPPCPYRDPGLVIIDSGLTAVGGWDGVSSTDKLFSLRQKQWVEDYPPMSIKRYSPIVVTSGDGNIIVMGGIEGWNNTRAIELLEVKTRRWSRLRDLPPPLHLGSATLCGDQVCTIGVDAKGYSCSLRALPSTNQPSTSLEESHALSWLPLPRLPVTESTAATLCGQLVIVGGRQRGQVPVDSIHQLVDGQWVKIGSLSSATADCVAVSLSQDKLMVLGGSVSIMLLYRALVVLSLVQSPYVYNH